jgi:lipoprotein-anchoring transpeptidase ErfK/SrfK
MYKSLGFALLTTCLATGAMAQDKPFTMEEVNQAGFADAASEGQSATAAKVQILLDRAGVSPGVIDGYLGENVSKALAAFERKQGLDADGALDEEVWRALGGDGAPVLTTYTITEDDVNGPFYEIPEDYSEMAKMERMGYRNPQEMLAERFHMDVDFLGSLNPGADFSSAGTEIVVADVGEDVTDAQLSRIEVDRSDGAVRAFGPNDELVVFYPATVGSEQNPSPSGTHEIVGIAPDAAYYYNPEVNFQQGSNTEKLKIPPGPNNPVGGIWIDLSKPTYGLHGTPEPAEIDKTQSHGCVRLTNWDAKELAGLAEQGLTVAFVE